MDVAEPHVDKIDLAEKLARIREHWRPHVVGELNGQELKLAKFQGTFVWHHHADADEMFLVVKGSMRLELRDRAIELREGEAFIVPRGVEHRTSADDEVHVLLITAADTRNTGNVVDPTLTAPGGLRI